MAKTKKAGQRARRKHETKPMHQANGFSRTRRDHQREQAEDYVELIQSLIRERGEARAVDMARALGVSHVTVSRTLTRLQKAGWIRTEPYRAVFLTEAGEDLAHKARSRHSVVIDFLIAAGVSPQTAVLDAEGIEHHVSPETLEALQGLTKKISKKE
jgi:DtxR family manganese transport transcriptional regulator